MSLDSMDVQLIVKGYLTKSEKQIKRFRNNTPGKDWMRSFLKSHNNSVEFRKCQNLKRSKGEVTRETMKNIFKNLNFRIEGVTLDCILNYDETNLTDDPGSKKCILKGELNVQNG